MVVSSPDKITAAQVDCPKPVVADVPSELRPDAPEQPYEQGIVTEISTTEIISTAKTNGHAAPTETTPFDSEEPSPKRMRTMEDQPEKSEQLEQQWVPMDTDDQPADSTLTVTVSDTLPLPFALEPSEPVAPAPALVEVGAPTTVAISESIPEAATDSVLAPAPEPEVASVLAPASEVVPSPKPEPAPQVESAPVVVPAPVSEPKPEPVSVSVPPPVQVYTPASAPAQEQAMSPPSAFTPMHVSKSALEINTSGGSSRAEIMQTVSIMTKEQHKYCTAMIRALKRHRDAGPFLNPVDIVALNIPDYPTIVTFPMDLGTIEKKLKFRQYQDTQAFCDDLRL
ncbi:hypothetical protein LPJ66_006294, partial [Kickxella alabastrina]